MHLPQVNFFEVALCFVPMHEPCAPLRGQRSPQRLERRRCRIQWLSDLFLQTGKPQLSCLPVCYYLTPKVTISFWSFCTERTVEPCFISGTAHFSRKCLALGVGATLWLGSWQAACCLSICREKLVPDGEGWGVNSSPWSQTRGERDHILYWSLELLRIVECTPKTLRDDTEDISSVAYIRYLVTDLLLHVKFPKPRLSISEWYIPEGFQCCPVIVTKLSVEAEYHDTGQVLLSFIQCLGCITVKGYISVVQS